MSIIDKSNDTAKEIKQLQTMIIVLQKQVRALVVQQKRSVSKERDLENKIAHIIGSIRRQ